MAILDAFLQLSDAQAVTTSAASTNIIDTKSELGDALEKGAWLRVAVQTSFTMAGATKTLQATFMSADDTAFNTGAVTHAATAALASTACTAGKELLVMKLPKNVKRYIRLYYTCGDTASAGKIDAHIVTDVDSLITDVEPA
jgi:hypothetical protein